MLPLIIAACIASASFSDAAIVDAIGRAENSARYPYGVKSIDCHGDAAKARKICMNSVKRGRARWPKSKSRLDLVDFIGLRYSPPTTNPHWAKNVKYFLRKSLDKQRK